MSSSFTGDMMGRYLASLGRSARRFLREESGAQLVEFAIVLPLMLVIFGVIVEGGRLMWSYQAAVAGVRDATRFLARVTPRDVCDLGGELEDYSTTLTEIVQSASDGSAIFPGGVTVTSVEPSLSCHDGDFRSASAPIVTVTAEMEVTFPFAGLFQLVGGALPTLETQVADQSRVYGS